MTLEPFRGFQSPNPRISLASFNGIELLHPYAALAAATGTFPPDLALDASDCWDLFSVLDSVARSSGQDEIIKEVKQLRPEIFFVTTECIKNADVIKYEGALRRVIERWIASTSCKDIMASVVSALGGTIEKQVEIVEESYKDKSQYNRDEHQKSLLTLLNLLNSADALPALVFHYDRHGIECLAEELVSALEDAEKVWKERNATWKSKLESWEEWKSKEKIRQKQKDKAMKSMKEKSREEMSRDEEGSRLESFDPETPLPEFSFQSLRSRKSGQELEADVKELRRFTDMPEWMIKCLRRGIGIHHSGLNQKVRTLVETLFRAGTLRVVIATGAQLSRSSTHVQGHWHLG